MKLSVTEFLRRIVLSTAIVVAVEAVFVQRGYAD